MIFKNSYAHSSVTNTEVIVAAENQKKKCASKSELCSVFKIVSCADLKTVAPLAVPVECLTRGYHAPLVALYGPPFAY